MRPSARYPYYGYPPPRRWRGPSLLTEACCFSEGACCAAESLECLGPGMLLVALRTLLVAPASPAGTAPEGGRAARRLRAAVRHYRTEISPRRPACCRYTPTCSAYAEEALVRFGATRGTWLTVRRLLRCRPRVPRGRHDPVPPAREGR